MDTCYTPICPRRETCHLWHLAQEALQSGRYFLEVVSPALIDKVGGFEACPHYYEHKLRRYARGLRWTYGELTVSQQTAIQEELTWHFGYRRIRRMVNGSEAVSPEEQEYIRSVFARYTEGVKPEYRDYEHHYTKPPRRQ